MKNKIFKFGIKGERTDYLLNVLFFLISLLTVFGIFGTILSIHSILFPKEEEKIRSVIFYIPAKEVRSIHE